LRAQYSQAFQIQHQTIRRPFVADVDQSTFPLRVVAFPTDGNQRFNFGPAAGVNVVCTEIAGVGQKGDRGIQPCG
jgi:hypothetical protein